MDIFPPSGNPWRTPSGDADLVSVKVTRGGDREVTIRPGADAADVATALGAVPADAVFTDHYGEIDAVLVFRPIPDVPATVPTDSPGPLAPLASAVR
jgi:uncharacterized repeat protein (TIGR03917 family)